MHELIFIEIEQFSKKLDKVSDISFMIELQKELLHDPEKGDVIKGTAGARKIRMAATGRGKRGGSRVIYYYGISVEKFGFSISIKNQIRRTFQQWTKSGLRL